MSSRSGLSNSQRFPHRKRNGKHLCRYCGRVLSGRKTSFCGRHCLRDFFMRTDWQRVRLVVFERDGHICMKCGKHIRGKEFHVDHICPISKGGAEWSLENLQLTCPRCNLSKQARYKKSQGGQTEREYKLVEYRRKKKIRSL